MSTARPELAGEEHSAVSGMQAQLKADIVRSLKASR